MLSLDLWSLGAPGNSLNQHEPSRKELTFEDALAWSADSSPASVQHSAQWKLEVLTAYAGHHGEYIVPFEQLVRALGFEPADTDKVAGFVAFDAYMPNPPQSHPVARVRKYCLVDFAFGVYWVWCPQSRYTRVLIYGEKGEGTRQVGNISRRIQATLPGDLSNPLCVGAAALETEISEMESAVATHSDKLITLQLRTGHHAYDGLPAQAVDTSKLAEMSREVCGIAMNISTTALCLRRTVKYADFLVEEYRGFNEALLNTAGADASIVTLAKEVRSSQAEARSRIHFWRCRADCLHDEAETWKHKATILVQTVYTLTTQRDTSISIEIAQDSRTLAQKATRDSNSMKAIAAVTMCFLPGTFVASLFSMDIFNWPLRAEQTVSNKFWVYWLVTLPLTLFVLAVWWAWTNRKALVAVLQKSSSGSRREQKETAAV